MAATNPRATTEPAARAAELGAGEGVAVAPEVGVAVVSPAGPGEEVALASVAAVAGVDGGSTAGLVAPSMQVQGVVVMPVTGLLQAR